MLLWKLKLLLQIKIFLRYLGRGVTLTIDTLAKHRWKGSLKYSFCNQNETICIFHLIVTCKKYLENYLLCSKYRETQQY
jgi:hypothetical protein